MIREMTYYWAARTIGKRVVMQFTRDGKEQKWADAVSDFGNTFMRIYWLPFDHEVAASLIRSRVAFWPRVTNNPVLWLDIPPRENGIPLYTIDNEKFSYWRCESCKGTIIHYDPTRDLICPHCGAKNEWYCHHCKTVIETPIFKPKGKTECPICLKERGEPYGLKRTKALTLHNETLHVARYSLAIDNKYAVQYDESGHFIRKYKVGKLI